MWGSQVLSGDTSSSTLPGVFLGCIPTTAHCKACWKGWLQALLLNIPGNYSFGAAWKRWGTAEEKGSAAAVTL